VVKMSNEEILLNGIFKTEVPVKFGKEKKLVVIDAFAQFSQNPTSMSASYGVEENYPFIGENLKKRYNIGKITVDNILNFLKKSFEKMMIINPNVYFWRDAISDYIKEEYAETFLQWYNSLFTKLSEEERQRFLFLLISSEYGLSIRDLQKWFCCFFDKEETLSQSDFEDYLIRLGIGNILYYRSSSGYETSEFRYCLLIDSLKGKFKEKIPTNEEEIFDFFKNLLITNVKLIEKCSKEMPPVLESTMGRVTQTASLIVESSKSYFAISPFALRKLKELIKAKKEDLIMEWKTKFSNLLNSFVSENYPYMDLNTIFAIEGAYCWEIRYVESPEKAPIKVCILLSLYLFPLTRSSTILDEMRRTTWAYPLNLIFLLEETFPAIADALTYISSQKYLIFLYEKRSQRFYVIEKSTLPEDMMLTIDNFLSKFLPFLEKNIRIGKTSPEYLSEYIENLRYFNKFPKLVSIHNRILKVEPKLREAIRKKLQDKFGAQWKDKMIKINPTLVKKCENVIEKRPDKEKAKDFLDGATLGELITIAGNFPDIFTLEKILLKAS